MVSRRALGGTFAVLMTFALFGALSGSADAAEMRRDTHVYLLRGAMNIWSLGLDDLADEIRQHGIQATVGNHLDASDMAAEALAGYRKGVRHIILIGHSWGANAAVDVAADLSKAKVPVDLIVLFDPSAGRAVVPRNVRKVVNFYIPTGLGYAAVGAKGQVQNIDEENNPDVGHLNIEKNKKLHAQTIRLILAAIGGSRRVPPPASSASVK
jgi:hypothetical protein